MPEAYIGLGSNLGDPEKQLKQALRLLQQRVNVQVISSIYQSSPVGGVEQNDFLNLVVTVDTDLTAWELLAVCQGIEHALKRKRRIRWGPRTIDLDILAYGKEVSTHPDLTIPHPRMHERGFVLIPLQEIAPNFQLYGKPLKEYIEKLKAEDTLVKVSAFS